MAQSRGEAVIQVKPCGLRGCLEPVPAVSARVSGGRGARLGSFWPHCTEDARSPGRTRGTPGLAGAGTSPHYIPGSGAGASPHSPAASALTQFPLFEFVKPRCFQTTGSLIFVFTLTVREVR